MSRERDWPHCFGPNTWELLMYVGVGCVGGLACLFLGVILFELNEKREKMMEDSSDEESKDLGNSTNTKGPGGKKGKGGKWGPPPKGNYKGKKGGPWKGYKDIEWDNNGPGKGYNKGYWGEDWDDWYAYDEYYGYGGDGYGGDEQNDGY